MTYRKITRSHTTYRRVTHSRMIDRKVTYTQAYLLNPILAGLVLKAFPPRGQLHPERGQGDTQLTRIPHTEITNALLLPHTRQFATTLPTEKLLTHIRQKECYSLTHDRQLSCLHTIIPPEPHPRWACAQSYSIPRSAPPRKVS